MRPDKRACVVTQPFMRAGGREKKDLRQDPPPDLAVEVKRTGGSLDRMDMDDALGIF
ncbi:MAG: hypothetical protein GTO26_12170 [Planctomycetales bacterium]|nr:hypothetical protein [Planctomycetales bacterium]NIP70947.1 hypothetical protein [Planctomycetales bacterium]